MSKRYHRRVAVTVLLVLAASLTGLFATNVDDITAARAVPASSAGQPDIGEGDANAQAPFSMSAPIGSIVKMVSALIIVILCIYAGLYLLRRLLQARRKGSGSADLLEVIQSTYVGPKKTVSLLRVADRSVLIGVTDSQISVLAELDAEQTAAILEREPDKEGRENFGRLLAAAAGRLGRFATKGKAAVQQG
ncbi:MAG TPA: flagellar biosynthetic protein FliO [Acidobacteriota bacterium]|nr:flagellar biosynthetic protein FliO [Acidobacteriota bacterium]